MKRVIFALLCVFISVGFASAQSPSITSGLNWLGENQNIDKSWGNATSLTTQFTATSEALDAMRRNGSLGTPYQEGFGWLDPQPLDSTNFASTHLLIRARSGLDVTDDLKLLLNLRNSTDGLWGLDSDYSTDTHNTALGLQALKAVNYSDITLFNSALAYLTTNQNSDGGWGFARGDDSNVYMTAVVSATLQQFPQMSTIATAVNNATGYLRAHQGSDGGFGDSPSTVYETALAYSALVAVSNDAAMLGGAVNYLSANQSANGSWNDDPYSTALALKALHLSENKPSPPPPPPAGGKIIGTVIDAVTKARVSGVAVVLAANSLLNTTTDSSGNFALSDVPPGTQTVNFSLSGYASQTAPASVVVDSVANIGNVEMLSSYTTGSIAGVITDGAGKPLQDVSVAVTGAWSGSAVTGADGSYSFTYVTPGEVTIAAAKPSFQITTGTGTVFARTKLSFSPRMTTTPSQSVTGNLVGRVVDSYWGVPIDHLPGEEGVTVTVSGGITVAADPDARGAFDIQGLVPDTYQVTVGMRGYASQTFRLVITPGTTTDLGTIRLAMSFAMTLTGKVTDASTGAPIPNAEVAVTGSDLTGRTDFTGTYVITNIDIPEFTLKASAIGYTGTTFTVGKAAWTQTMDIALTPQMTAGSLAGTVIDAISKQPLGEVTLTLHSDPSVSATTNDIGRFTFSTIPQGPQQVRLVLSGYAQRTMATAITAGTVNEVGYITLSNTPLAASVQGRVWDAVANAPFAGVNIQVSGAGSSQTVTDAEGRYSIDNVEPGAVTVVTGAVPKPRYSSARFTGTLDPGGILVFNPMLSTTLPVAVDLAVQSEKSVYKTGDTVGIAIKLQNLQSVDTVVSMHVQVIDPTGVNVFESSANVDLVADGAINQPFNFVLPLSAQVGTFVIRADVYDANGAMLKEAAKSFGVAVSQIAITPNYPGSFSTGANTVSFNLTNSGTLAVSAGALALTLKDPAGQVVSTTSISFGLEPGQSTTLTHTVTIPMLRFGTYTLSYTESDETRVGPTTEISLPNTLAVKALFDDTSHRVRATANLAVGFENTGRFNLGSAGTTGAGITVTVSVPDAAYSETKNLSPLTARGNASAGALLYSFAIPETVAAGQHGVKITAALPSGSTLVQTTQLAIMESSLSLSPIEAVYTVGDTIHPVVSNSGGVDTQVQYSLSLYDAKSTLIAEKVANETVAAAATLPLSLPIPTGAVDGSYNLMVNYKDVKTGTEGMVPNPVFINGVKGSLQVQTNKESYLLTENVAGLSTISSSGSPLQGGNLHLQVTTGPGSQKVKTWTAQADFQTGVRSGVDTYGVNDWIVPDDDFNGTTIDTNKWKTSNNVTVQSGKLLINCSAVPSLAESKWQLEGDFDVQVDFDSNNSVALQGAEFGIRSGSFWVYIHNIQAGVYGSGIYLDGADMGSKNMGSYSQSGRFRITRISNTITTYFWSGSSWTEVYKGSDPKLAQPGSVRLWIWDGPGVSSASTAFDNLKVNSGRIKTEKQAVDSVRLLPLNDNFDDGVLNEDRWKVSGPKPVENMGLVRLTSTAAAASNVLSLSPGLTGDFTAVSVYKNYDALPAKTLQGRYIMAAGVDNSSFYINRSSYDLTRAGGDFIVSLSRVGTSWQMTGDVPYSPSMGKFRLRRAGSTGFTDYWDGANWINQHSRDSIPISTATVSLYTLSQDNMPTITTDLDAFYTNKGTYANDGTLALRYDSETTDNKWEKLLFSADVVVGSSVKFRTRTAETLAGLSTAAWSGFVTNSGSNITSLPGRWIEIEASLSTADSNATPVLKEVSVTYTAQSDEVLWHADLPSNLVAGAANDTTHAIGTLGVIGKLYLQGTVTSSTGQTVASAEYPFYVEQGNIQVILAPDKKVYRPGEMVTIGGEVRNRSSVAAAGLSLQVQSAELGTTLYADSFDLPANSTRSFNFTTTAGDEGVYQVTGAVTQNTATLAETTDLYEVATPALTATLTAPETVGTAPFTIAVLLNNTGKVGATTSIHVEEEGGDVVSNQAVTLAAGEYKVLQFTGQITGAMTYTAVISGDLTQTLTQRVAFVDVPTDSSVTGKIVADKISYNPNEQVALTTTASAGSMRENLSALVTVINSQGQGVYSATAAIPVLIQGQVVTNKIYWNSGSYPAGTYLATLQIVNSAGVPVSTSTCNVVINSTTKPTALLKGQISLDRQSILTGEPVSVSYSITNAGNVDLTGIDLSLLTVGVNEETVFNSSSDQTSLAMGASYNSSSRIDTLSYTAKDYLVLLRGSIAGGEVETLGSAYFRVEGAPSAPALSGPAQGADVETFIPTLSVSNAADPNDNRLSYQFEIYSDSGLTSLVDSGTVTETAGITAWTVSTPLTENQTYSWRVRAYDGLLYGPWMASASFRVNTANDLPAPPAISSPVDGTDVAVLNPILSIGNTTDPDSANLTYNFEVALDPAFTQVIASMKGVTSGEGTSSWAVPESLLENTLYYWRAQADDWLSEGPWSTTARFLVNTVNDAPSAPVVLAPASGSTITSLAMDATVRNSADPDSPALAYYFEADTVPTFDSTHIIRSGSVPAGQDTTSWQLSGLQDNTRYHLRVKASDGTAESAWSAVPIFFVNTANDAPTVPILANPSNGGAVSVAAPTLAVHNATDLDQDALSYEFELYADQAMTNLVAGADGIGEMPLITEWQVPHSLQENGTYYWRARAFDGARNSDWSATASFMVNTANDAPDAPKLSSPAEGSSVAILLPQLAVVNAVDPDSYSLSYQFEIYAGGSLVSESGAVTGDSSGITTWTPVSPLADNAVYQWRARAFDGDSYGAWMDMASFTVHIPQTSINATVDFDPDTLNRSSKGTWVVVYIELPTGYLPADVDVASVRLEGSIPAESHPYCIGDHDKDGIPDLMVKFNRSDLINLLTAGDKVTVQVTGKVGSMLFEGVDVIRVIK